MMRPDRAVGIVGYGAYVPRFRIAAAEIGRVWGESGPYPVEEKSVPGPDEDTATMAIEAARNALARCGELDPREIRAVWVGSESHPYAVKPTGTVVAEALGATPAAMGADLEFACKAGSEALQMAVALVGSGMARYALAAGVDTAQGRPGDALEYTAAAGGAAYIIGPAEESLACLEASFSFMSDTPDFWRRPYQHFPRHGSRFTGTPAYFRHVGAAGQAIMDALGYSAADVAHVVLHQPNARFPIQAARGLGFSAEQYQTGLLSPRIGNTYAGAALVGLSAVLDVAQPGDRILVVSYGSGAGSDAFVWQATEQLVARRERAPTTEAYIARRQPIDYGLYVRYRKKLHTH
ncbi:MAG: hydroxymethylglutaryl-CoA synthase [Anaerolineae bacterium]|nr:hydroxymethylglutaryl-CoA synthase [Anaerolineae bacterium]